MRKHFRYARSLARHKWRVLVAGLRIGPGALWRWPAWILRLLVHDWSKLLPSEWTPYARQLRGDSDWPPLTAEPVLADFERAWLRHLHRQPHHWQHWILRRDDGTTTVLPMPEVYVREMVADWMAAGRAITGRWDDAVDWYLRNRTWIRQHPDTQAIVEELLGITPAPLRAARANL